MKKEIIIFKDRKPSQEEVCKSIEFFCKEHSMRCAKVPRKTCLKYKIDGEVYSAVVSEGSSDQPEYWMIRCACNTRRQKSRFVKRGVQI